MTVKVFLFGSILATAVSAAIWLLIVTYLDPARAGLGGFILFFLSLFIATTGVVSLLGYGARLIVMPRQFAAYRVRASLRQGTLIALLSSGLLALQLFRLYRWWLALLMVILFVSCELIFLSYDRSLRRHLHST